MKFPSLQTLWNGFQNVLSRFPVQSMIILMTGGLWISTTYLSDQSDQEWIIEIVVLCNLAFTSSLSANLFSERKSFSGSKSLLIQLAALIPAAILFAVLKPGELATDSTRLILSLLAGHLLLSFSVWSNQLPILQFWHFNKALFLRFLTGVLFSIILFAGISVALLSVQTLFNYRFDGEIFFRLFILISVVFNSVFFLAGVPGLPGGNTCAPLLETTYPKILKIFTQYVLIPLLTIYFGILIVYELKIAFSFQLPNGTVTYLVLGYSVFGILSYLLIYPLKDGAGNEWIRYFSKLFFWLMMPLLVLLFIAIGVRIADYGLTEKRYLVLALSIWLTGISLYFSLSRNPRLVLIPSSLFLVLFLSVAGPQNATNLSRLSQQSRLEETLNSTDARSLAQKESIVRYLVDFHGLEALQPFTERDMKNLKQRIEGAGAGKLTGWQKKQQIRDSAFHLLSVEPSHEYSPTIFVSPHRELISSKGFEYVYWFEQSQNEEIKSASGTVKIIPHQSQLHIAFPEQDTIKFDLTHLEAEMQERFNDPQSRRNFVEQESHYAYSVPEHWLTLKDSSSRYVVELHLQSFSFSGQSSTQYPILPSARGLLLIKRSGLDAF